jgi:HEPN domain-containing protein
MSGQPESNLDEARRWLAQASEDVSTAERLSKDPESPARIVCFLAHLSAEKAMKAWLIASGIPFRKVHDLAELLALLPADAAGRLDTADLQTLNPWSILGRYPDDVSDATDEQALASVAAAQRVLEAVVIDADYP